MLTPDERHSLDTYARSRAGRADLAQRARVVLMLADGASYTDVTTAVGWSSATIAKWKTRFEANRLADCGAAIEARSRGSARPRWRLGF
jgi:transposase